MDDEERVLCMAGFRIWPDGTLPHLRSGANC